MGSLGEFTHFLEQNLSKVGYITNKYLRQKLCKILHKISIHKIDENETNLIWIQSKNVILRVQSIFSSNDDLSCNDSRKCVAIDKAAHNFSK